MLLDLRDSWWAAANPRWLRKLRAFQSQVEAHPDLHLVDADDGLLLYARQGIRLDPRIVVERDDLPPNVVHRQIDLGGGVRIVAYSLATAPSESEPGAECVRVTTFSAVVAPTNLDLAVRCILDYRTSNTETDSYISASQPLGQGIWPIARWDTNKFYVDEFLIVSPEKHVSEPLRVRFESAPLTD